MTTSWLPSSPGWYTTAFASCADLSVYPPAKRSPISPSCSCPRSGWYALARSFTHCNARSSSLFFFLTFLIEEYKSRSARSQTQKVSRFRTITRRSLTQAVMWLQRPTGQKQMECHEFTFATCNVRPRGAALKVMWFVLFNWIGCASCAQIRWNVGSVHTKLLRLNVRKFLDWCSQFS